MALAFIGLGSNLGDGRANLREAWRRLGKTAGVTPLTLSSPYLTAPVGMPSEQWFTNAVGAMETTLAPQPLLDLLLGIERAMGRDRSKGEDRIVDLDLLFYNDLVQNSATLVLPHPEFHRRLFVLAPLAELAPDHVDPRSGLGVRQMHRTLAADTTQMIRRTAWPEREEKH
ncbi:MAG: 2-amino-4-hydroxy-6-hydroxymethyldihydropteridine diphosphokinase [Desulfobulbaceae bacterium]|nr:2-amino-4-hydroxy-6-hydroxymethyldihydropteridine diphosphokinase [Desulfobulbaceae bacterium]